MRADLLADEATDQSLELDGRFVVGAAFGTAIAGLADRTQALEHPQSLAGRALADVEALHQIVQRQARSAK